jgi:zinc protease
VALAMGCGGGATPSRGGTTVTRVDMDEEVITVERPQRSRVAPPPSGPARDVRFPPIVRARTASGLELNTVVSDALPVAHLRLVVRSGGAQDPADLPGVAHLVAEMLKEGTRTRSSARLAEDVEYLGASLDVSSDEESVVISARCLKEHLGALLEIVADVATSPAFSDAELRKLKRRELDRLQIQLSDPNFLAAREFYSALYGDHPYARIDTTPEVVRRVRRQDLAAWHARHFVPNNAFLVVVGDVTADEVERTAESVFARWRRGEVPAKSYGATPVRTERRVVVVDRPESVQSVISVGNLALARRDPAFVPLLVANQVLGGSPASRLFMDLRERRSLTYGAGSRIAETAEVGPFRAYASVRNAVTAEAMDAFMEHLERITREAVPEAELRDAQRYLSDSFPLKIETPANIAALVAQLRLFGLPDDYWDTFRTQIRQVSAEQALEAARTYIRPDTAVVVVVGRAADVAEPLRAWGEVSIVDVQGRLREVLPRR